MEAAAPINSWIEPPETVGAEAHTLDVWRVRLSQHFASLEQLESLLDEREHQRAAAYRFPELRQRYIGRHGVLRLILACYTGKLPSDIQFEFGPSGKPKLPPHFGAVQFNLSDSGDIAVIAVAGDAEVGVDVEQINRSRPPLEILPQLAPSEQIAVEAAEPSRRAGALYQIWVRKEAYLKSIGAGLGLVQLHKFAVPCAGPGDNSFWQMATADGTFHGCDFVADHDFMVSAVSPAPFGSVRLFDASVAWAQRTFHSFERHKYLLASAR